MNTEFYHDYLESKARGAALAGDRKTIELLLSVAKERNEFPNLTISTTKSVVETVFLKKLTRGGLQREDRELYDGLVQKINKAPAYLRVSLVASAAMNVCSGFPLSQIAELLGIKLGRE